MPVAKKAPQTPLMLAASKGNAFEVATLLAEGADPTIQDEFGMTAQHKAEEMGFPEIAALLDLGDDTIIDYDQTIIDYDKTIIDYDQNTPAEEGILNYEQTTATEEGISEYEHIIKNAIEEDDTVPQLKSEILSSISKSINCEHNDKSSSSPELSKIIITGFQIPFINMIVFMLKWLSATLIASSLIASIIYIVIFIIKTYIL